MGRPDPRRGAVPRQTPGHLLVPDGAIAPPWGARSRAHRPPFDGGNRRLPRRDFDLFRGPDGDRRRQKTTGRAHFCARPGGRGAVRALGPRRRARHPARPVRSGRDRCGLPRVGLRTRPRVPLGLPRTGRPVLCARGADQGPPRDRGHRPRRVRCARVAHRPRARQPVVLARFRDRRPRVRGLRRPRRGLRDRRRQHGDARGDRRKHRRRAVGLVPRRVVQSGDPTPPGSCCRRGDYRAVGVEHDGGGAGRRRGCRGGGGRGSERQPAFVGRRQPPEKRGFFSRMGCSRSVCSAGSSCGGSHLADRKYHGALCSVSRGCVLVSC